MSRVEPESNHIYRLRRNTPEGTRRRNAAQAGSQAAATDSTYSALQFVKTQLVNLAAATDTASVRVRANLKVPSMSAS